MKKLKLFLVSAMVLIGAISCSDDNNGSDPDIIWDFVNYSIEFNLSEKALNDSVFLSKIKISYNGKEYVYKKNNWGNYFNGTKANMPRPLAIRCYNYNYPYDKNKPNTILSFGEFAPDDGKNKNQKFTIDWGNGRVDKVEFDIYITWKKGNPTVHKKLKFNGEECEFAPISIPL